MPVLARADAPYRTFWLRVGAAFIDALVLSPLFLIEGWVYSAGGSTALAFVWTSGYALMLAYSIVLHARYGQTIGKRVMGVLVLDVGGRRISTRQAVLRDVPNIAMAVVSTAVYVPLILDGMNPFDSSERSLTRSEMFEAVLGLTWSGLEIVTMLTNRKRRSLHDFIAGTVVVRRDSLDEVPTVARVDTHLTSPDVSGHA